MPRNERSAPDVRREIASEREELAGAVDRLRKEIDQLTDVGAKLRANLPVVAAAAAGAGFLLAGGVGATMRLLARRSREGRETARIGPFSIVERR